MTSQDVDTLVVKAVEDHYAESNSPLYLAELGNVFRNSGIEIPSGVRFKDYLISRFHNSFSVIQDPDIPARIAIALPGNESLIRRQLAGHGMDLGTDSKIDFSRLPVALLAAFCKVPLPNTQVYFRTTKPLRYETLLRPPDSSYLEIDNEFRPLSLAGKSVYELSLSEKQTIHSCVAKWADAKSIDLRSLYYDGGHARHGRKGQDREASHNALQRLINAQEPEMRLHIKIPGDIASTLMRLP